MDNLHEAVNIANDLSKKMNDLMRLYQRSVATLPIAERQKLQSVTDDINKSIKCAESGDLSTLQEIMNKYAGTDSVSPVL